MRSWTWKFFEKRRRTLPMCRDEVMDLASRRIVGWSMSEAIDAKLVCAALRSAYWQRKPGVGLLVHTDRGSQYASHEYRRLAADFGITMSRSRKGNAWDNAAMESFFKTLKVERIYQVRYDTRDQARLDIGAASTRRSSALCRCSSFLRPDQGLQFFRYATSARSRSFSSCRACTGSVMGRSGGDGQCLSGFMRGRPCFLLVSACTPPSSRRRRQFTI